MLRKRSAVCTLLSVLVLGVSILPAFAGDSFYGKVREVKSADLVRLEDEFGGYDIRLVGIDVPKEGRFAEEAREFVVKLVLGKNARMRLERRLRDGELLARLFTDDPELGIKDVGAELVKAGFARRQQGFDYKYGELAAAERAAREAKRGLWANPQ